MAVERREGRHAGPVQMRNRLAQMLLNFIGKRAFPRPGGQDHRAMRATQFFDHVRGQFCGVTLRRICASRC